MTVSFIHNDTVITTADFSVCPREDETYELFGKEYCVISTEHTATVRMKRNGKQSVREVVRCYVTDNEKSTERKFVKSNLNSYIKAILTKKGREVFCEYYGTKEFTRETDEKGFVSFQIHEFMRVFGAYMYLTSEKVCEMIILVESN